MAPSQRKMVKQALMLGYNKIKLSEELSMQIHQKKDLDAFWKEKLLKLKIPLMKEDIKLYWTCFDLAIEKKNIVIEKLTNYLDQVEIQHRLNILAIMDAFRFQFNDYKTMMSKMCEKFKEQMSVVRQVGKNENDIIKSKYDKSVKVINILKYIMEKDQEEHSRGYTGTTSVLVEENKINLNDKVKSMQASLQKQFHAVWQQFQNVVNDKLRALEEKLCRLKALEARRVKSESVMEKQQKDIRKNTIIIKILRDDVETLNASKEKSKIPRKSFKENAQKFNEKNDRNNLNNLVEISSKTLKYLDNIVEKGEQILTLVKLCRSLETENEKRTDRKKQSYVNDIQFVAPINNDEDIQSLRGFWRRFGDAELLKMALEKEKKLLLSDNRCIKIEIKNFFNHQTAHSAVDTWNENNRHVPVVDAQELIKYVV